MTDMAERVARFRDALFALDPATLRDGVGRLPRAVSQSLHKAAGTPFPALGRLPDPRTALRRVRDLPLLSAVADAGAQPCLEVTLELLGDSADDPTVEELRGVLPTITEQFSMPVVRLLFASIAMSDAVAADKCDEIVRVDLPAPEESSAEDTSTTDDAASPSSATAAKETNDELREARRARRKAQQDEKRKQQEAHQRGRQALRDAKRARPAASSSASDDAPAPAVVDVHRREAQLTPEQSADFDTTDELVGSILIALVPFDDDGPAQPGPQQKRRPAIVIGASPSQLLVRPCYSEGGLQSRRWQSHPLRDWVAAGLQRATFVEDEARAIPRVDAGDPLGRISTEDWNALW